MAPYNANRMTRFEMRALLALYDGGSQTAYNLKADARTTLANLIKRGFVTRRTRRPLTYVGKSITIYSLTDLGRQEVILTGKRFGLTQKA